MAIKGRHEGSCDDGSLPYIDCLAISIPVVTLYYSSARCYLWWYLGKVKVDSLFVHSYNCM